MHRIAIIFLSFLPLVSAATLIEFESTLEYPFEGYPTETQVSGTVIVADFGEFIWNGSVFSYPVTAGTLNFGNDVLNVIPIYVYDPDPMVAIAKSQLSIANNVSYSWPYAAGSDVIHLRLYWGGFSFLDLYFEDATGSFLSDSNAPDLNTVPEWSSWIIDQGAQYPLQVAIFSSHPVPEPSGAILAAVGSLLTFGRRRNPKGEQGAAEQPAISSSNS